MMELTYPKTQNEWDAWKKRVFPGIPTRQWLPSGYKMIGCCRTRFDVYVAFTNQKQTDVWIEKTSILMGRDMLTTEDLVRIEDEDEFSFVHRFFINKGILDGKKDN